LSVAATQRLKSGVLLSGLWVAERFGVAVTFCAQLGVVSKHAAQQSAAPDRLQLRSSFLLTALPAAGELGRSAAARGVSVA
jgi:hypothetical protein